MHADRRARRKELLGAIERGDSGTVRELCAEDPSLADAPNAHRNTPISHAVGLGDVAMVQLLAELGADPQQRNHGGTSLLEIAASRGHVELFDWLLSVGCEVSPFEAARAGRVALLEILIGADPEVLTRPDERRGHTLLHHAAASGSAEAVGWLLASGASPHASGREGHTPLSLAVEAGRGRGIDAARLLLDAGADPGGPAGWHGGSLLHRAIMNRDVELARLLLERGADPDVTDWSGLSPRDRARRTSRAMAALFDDPPTHRVITSDPRGGC